VLLRKENDPGDESQDGDPTDEMVQWARDRVAAVSETTPGKMGPPQATELESDPDPSASDNIPSGVETGVQTTLKQERKILVVVLPESTTDQSQAHLFDESQEASLFMETLVESGVNPDGVIVFWGTPMNFNVTYRPVVNIDEPEQEPTIAS
jgi:hypothetical protein